jgi:hypothetical protein
MGTSPGRRTPAASFFCHQAAHLFDHLWVQQSDRRFDLGLRQRPIDRLAQQLHVRPNLFGGFGGWLGGFPFAENSSSPATTMRDQ